MCCIFFIPLLFLIFVASIFTIGIVGATFIGILLAGIFMYKIMKQNPPETFQSLLKYEYKPGQTQKFLARVGMNFRWPFSMPEYLRRDAFIKIADVDLEFEDEVRFNMIFFYNALDRGEFVGHEDKWVTVNDQKVIEYGEEYSDDQLNSVFEIMPNAIQLPVDQTRLPQSKPTKMVIAQRTNNGDDHKV
ncbi:ATP dependent DNA helicase [Gigaspora margarita]|nr:ATP dependent DNA helicase [Gigaspora margarita]